MRDGVPVVTPGPEIHRARERWHDLFARLGARVAPRSAFDALVACYEEPHRVYHRFAHVLDCLATFDPVSSSAERPPEVEAAIWFHDAVYDPRRQDNEARSADRAEQVLMASGVAADATGRVRQLVLATRHDAAPETPDARLLLDVDLSVLGRDEAGYRTYEAQIRQEYAWVPDEVFHSRRAALLEAFLRRDPLYLTPTLRTRLEPRARANLARAVADHRARAAALPSDGGG